MRSINVKEIPESAVFYRNNGYGYFHPNARADGVSFLPANGEVNWGWAVRIQVDLENLLNRFAALVNGETSRYAAVGPAVQSDRYLFSGPGPAVEPSNPNIKLDIKVPVFSGKQVWRTRGEYIR